MHIIIPWGKHVDLLLQIGSCEFIDSGKMTATVITSSSSWFNILDKSCE